MSQSDAIKIVCSIVSSKRAFGHYIWRKGVGDRL